MPDHDICGKRKQKSITQQDDGTLRWLGVHDMAEVVKRMMPYVAGPDKLTRSELCALLAPYVKRGRALDDGVTFPRYDGENSCYIDSLLAALFLTAPVKRSGWVERVLLRHSAPVIPALQRMYTMMHLAHEKSLTARDLRKEMHRHFPHGEWRHTMNDPNEVLELMNLPRDMKVQVRLTDGSKRQERWAINTLGVDIDVLMNTPDDSVFNLAKLFGERGYKASTGTTVRVLSARALYVPVFRAAMTPTGKEKKLAAKVIGPARITMPGDKRELKLRALIIHNGRSTHAGHYTAVLRVRGKGPWVLYDDMRPKVQPIGRKLRDVWAADDGYFTRNVSGFFYCA